MSGPAARARARAVAARLRQRLARNPRPERLSELLTELSEDKSRERIALSDLLDRLRVRAFGPLLVIFSLPNVLPTPPGTSAVLGLPLIFLTFQMLVGGPPWFPAFVAKRSLARADFARLTAVLVPRLSRAERLLKPRLGFLSSKWAEQGLGLLALVLAIILTLPIPLGNIGPAFALALIGLGLFERDGVWVLAGVAAGLVALAVVHGVIWAMVMAAMHVLETWS
ncbi:exopolysaccharide biosynthesis protein [Rhodobacter capsulatus]|uniref:exopolysaccharide biosynthesis protein n=1 Tax=Rhodobacter capsulatus TaxID=1061 RepID=UPI004025A9CC